MRAKPAAHFRACITSAVSFVRHKARPTLDENLARKQTD